MERQYDPSTGSPTPHEARTALARATGAHARTVARATSPWWYFPAVGACLLLAFASVSLGPPVVPYGVVLGLSLGPLLLTTAADHATGASLNRFYATAGARRVTSRLGPSVVVLMAVGLLLQWVADLRWAMAACGVVALVATVLAGRRLDAALARDLRERA